MEKHWAYCSACDRQVAVVLKPGGRANPGADEPEEMMICLEAGHTCTGALCPITDATPEEMRDALRSLEADPATDEED